MKEDKISRSTFIKGMLGLGLSTAIIPYGLAAAGSMTAYHPNTFSDAGDLMKRMVEANDARIESLLEAMQPGQSDYRRMRNYGHSFGILSASYCHPASIYHQDPNVAAALEGIIRKVIKRQNPDGTINAGNLGSPPDTAFMIEPIAAAAYILQKNNSKAIQGLLLESKSFLLRVGEALLSGGVHTPNHRWAVCAALARINRLYPDPRYRARIEDWLGEGIYQDSDGHYPERSRNYSRVVNHALITCARLMDMPELLEPVRKNLELTYYYMEADGSLVTTDSRRQDQYMSISIILFYLDYRYMAIHSGDGTFAAVTSFTELLDAFPDRVLSSQLVYFMEEPLLQKELPRATSLPGEYEKWIRSSHLLRIRREDTSMTLFGGVDWPLIIASGRSNSPNFFSYRKGEAVLKYLRISSMFFNTGYFYSEGLERKGNTYVLQRRLEVPYYQPMPEDMRNDSGDYRLSESIDGRFWNKMSFEDRPLSNVKTLKTTVTLEEDKGNAALNIQVEGPDDVHVVLELCFKEGGSLSGVEESGGESENAFLSSGMGIYQYGNDSIEFGPGTTEYRYVDRLEGERYSTHNGSLRTEGMHVYLTGRTPFEHSLKFS